MTVTYTVGDTREVIKGIADGSVDLIASSPPFLALRSYVPADHESKGDEIGSERNPAEFIDMLLGLTAEWGRVLAAHGSIAIELGDTYAGSGGAGGDYNDGGLRTGQTPYDGSSARGRSLVPGGDPSWRQGPNTFQGGGHKSGGGPGWPRAKSLALIPQLYAVALAYGINPLTGAPSPAGRWLVRNVIVWHRPNPAVGALGDKVRPSTSYIVVATRSPKRWFDLTAVRTAHQADPSTQKNTKADGFVKPVTGSRNVDGVGYCNGGNPAGAPPLDAWFDPYDGSHDTWTLTTQPSKLAHYAMWPAKLAERLILSMCPREVCRECGEPRRRMERMEYVKLQATNNATHRVGVTGVNGAGADPTFVHGRANSSPVTLGWSDCRCNIVEGEVTGCIHNNPATPSTLIAQIVEGPVDVFASAEATDPSTPSRFRPGRVLDPFAGSGTTLAVADLHGRDAIGIDFDARNKAIYPARYDEVKRALYGTPAPMPGQETFDFEDVAL